MEAGNELARLYRIRFEQDFLPRKREIWKVLCKDFFQKYVGHDATVVDVACGYGEFINNIQAQEKIAIDLNPDTAACLDSGVEFHALPASGLSKIGENRADIVFTSNFLEHLPNKSALNQFLGQVWSVLKPGGNYLILGPNLRYLPGEYWDYYDHQLGLTDRSLSEALEVNGFIVQKCVKKFLPYTTQGALPTHPVLVKLYLKMPFFWSFLGKQFFIVANKSE